MTESAERVCPSCLQLKVCEHEWDPDVPRPPHIVDDPICDDCHGSLRRVAGKDENPLMGEPPPPHDSVEAVSGLLAVTKRGLL